MVGVFNVGGWLTHGDLVLDAEVDFLAIVEHWLILARVSGPPCCDRSQARSRCLFFLLWSCTAVCDWCAF